MKQKGLVPSQIRHISVINWSPTLEAATDYKQSWDNDRQIQFISFMISTMIRNGEEQTEISWD